MFYRHSVFSNPGHENSRRGGDPTNVEVATSAWRETCQTSGCSDWPADQCGFGNTESRRWIGIHGWGTGRLLGFGQDVSSWHWSDRFKCACLNVKLLYINLMAKKTKDWSLEFYLRWNHRPQLLPWQKPKWRNTWCGMRKVFVKGNTGTGALLCPKWKGWWWSSLRRWFSHVTKGHTIQVPIEVMSLAQLKLQIGRNPGYKQHEDI